MPQKKKVGIIGAGLGGLSAAVYLASEGFEVSVFEKNAKIGGKLNQMEDRGFRFDLGPSILILPQFFQNVFAKAGRKMCYYVKIEPLYPHWRSFFEEGNPIDLCPEKAALINLQEAEGDLKRFLEYSRKLYELSDKGYFQAGNDTYWQMLNFYGLKKVVFGLDIFSTMNKGVERYIKDPRLQDVLNFFIKYVGSSPYDAPAILNLMAYSQFEYGLWYVSGGMYNLAQGLAKILDELGVKIHLNREVTALGTDKRRVTELRCADGSAFAADYFVSNMEVIPAYKNLLNTDSALLKKYEKKFEPACSGLVLHLGVSRKYEQLAHHNFFFSADCRKHFDTIFRKKQIPEDPTLYVVAPTVTDNTLAPEQCEIIKVLPHIPHLTDTPPSSEEYRALRERILGKLERMGLENLRRYIMVEHMWTPEDIQKLYYSNRGAIYGVVSDKKKNSGLKAPKKSETHDNLYFTGGSVNPGPGMPMVLLSGQQVGKMISEKAAGK